MDSIIPVKKPKHFINTLTSQHGSYCKLVALEHFDQNEATILCYIPFPISKVLDQHKTHKPVLAPKVKTDYKLPNYCNLKMRWYQNGNEDASNKLILKFLPTVLADSLRFSVGVSAYLNLLMSLVDILNCF